jgi:hypothetical protein
MSLPRKEVKPYFDHDVHAAIKAIAEAEGYGDGMAAWVEAVVVGIVKKRVHSANLVISRLSESGSLRTFTDES